MTQLWLTSSWMTWLNQSKCLAQLNNAYRKWCNHTAPTRLCWKAIHNLGMLRSYVVVYRGRQRRGWSPEDVSEPIPDGAFWVCRAAKQKVLHQHVLIWCCTSIADRAMHMALPPAPTVQHYKHAVSTCRHEKGLSFSVQTMTPTFEAAGF